MTAPEIIPVQEEANEVPEVVVAAPVVSAEMPKTAPSEENASAVVAKSYQNENITFLLIDQGPRLQAYITKSKIEKYKVGEMVGTFERTSLPNVFRVDWKEPETGIDQTTAYFDDKGNLKIDIHRNGVLEVITFEEVAK
jgi:hypothetical protein